MLVHVIQRVYIVPIYFCTVQITTQFIDLSRLSKFSSVFNSSLIFSRIRRDMLSLSHIHSLSVVLCKENINIIAVN
jgi:hypothetical protein